MSIHIGAEKGKIAEGILLPGDPLRAKYIADNFLENVEQYNNVRGMLGFTGTYKGKKVSVQGTGMGQPSISIYATELIKDYGVKKLIRIGTCGSMQKDVDLLDVILAQSASTDSSMNRNYFPGDFAPCSNFELLLKSYNYCKENNIKVKVGNILSADQFYNYDNEVWKKWAEFNVLAVEMEANALLTIASKFNVDALTILTVSDSLVTHKQISTEARQSSLNEMITIGLNTL